MRKNQYTDAVREIKAPEKAVAKMLETARSYDKKENIIDMKKFRFKGVIAASLAAVTAVGGAFGICSLLPKEKNTFTLTVDAAEITENNSVTINPKSADGVSISEGDGDKIGYTLGMPVMCEGENIDTITYSVDRGSFYVSWHKGNNPVISGEETTEFADCGGSTAFIQDDRNLLQNELENHTSEDGDNTDDDIMNRIIENYDSKCYSAFTVSGNNQLPDGTAIDLIGNADTLNEEDRSYVNAHREELFNLYDKYSLEEEHKVKDMLVGGITVTVKVRFKDGSEQTKKIVTGTTIGSFKDFYADEYNEMPDDVKNEKDYAGVFTTFRLA